MKKNILYLLIGVCISTTTIAQMGLESVNVAGGKTYSSFVYRNSVSQKDEYLSYTGLNSYGLNFNFTSDKHVLRPELMFRQAGATSESESLPISWRMNYFDVNFAYLYKVIETANFEVSPGLALGAGYMLNGEQFIGETRYNIANNESLKRFDFGFQGITNLKAKINQNFHVSLEYRFGMGISQIENDVNAQQTRNIYHSALLGLGFIINGSSAPRN